MRLLRTQIGEEVHLQGAGELRRRAEGNVDVLMEHLGDVRTRHLHPLRKLRLRHAELLHPEQNAAEERRTNFIYCGRSLQPTFWSPGGGGRWRWTMERLNPSVRLRLTPHLLKPTTQSPSFHQPRHTLQTHSSPPPLYSRSLTLADPFLNSAITHNIAPTLLSCIAMPSIL